MEHSRFEVSWKRTLVLLLAVLVVSSEPKCTRADDHNKGDGNGYAGNGMTGLCNAAVPSAILKHFIGTTATATPANMNCKVIWDSYTLRYYQTEENVLTIILTAGYTSGWVGIGFSKTGMMLNSSAMVGWVTPEGHRRIRQYHLEGYSRKEVKPNKGELPLTSIPPIVMLEGAKLSMAFQLKYPHRVTKQPIILAFGFRYPRAGTHRLSHHDDKTTIKFDFSSGESETFYGPNDRTKRAHGTLGLMAWGLVLPSGAIIARYFKHRDPLWYYLHVIIQFVGFLIVLPAVILGNSMYTSLHLNFPAHRGIGFFVLVLSILQVLAFFLRPDKNHKNRRYWNWYHHWCGRIALFFGALNIVLGIQIANAGNPWKIGYGFLLGTVLIVCIVLEVVSRRTKSEKPIPPNPDYQMNSF